MKIKHTIASDLNHRTSVRWRFYPLTALIRQALLSGILVSGMVSSAMAEDWFNPALLSIGGLSSSQTDVSDLSRFESGEQAPGVYHVSIYLNGAFLDTRDVNFIVGADSHLQPVFTRHDYMDMGVRPQATLAFAAVAEDSPVQDLPSVIPSATTTFQFSEQRLDITVPQMMMLPRARGAVDPRQWDHGVPAMLLDYILTGREFRQRSGNDSRTLYGNFRGGVNLGDWRLRSYATYSRSESAGQKATSDFRVINTYLQRNIPSLKAAMTLGDSATLSDIFDSVQFRGAQLSSDDSMLPDSQRGFAPVIRGVAQAGGQVTIRQNNNIIYQAYVPPGPFEITDLYPSGLSGDLVVTVKEDNGSEHTFTQAYSSVAVMQREGQMKYALTAGRLRNSSGNTHEPVFVQGTLMYGLPHDLTVYGGMQVAQDYRAATAGTGLGLGQLGALSADITRADATLQNGNKTQGQSYRLRYSKSLVETGTSVSLAAYRYSTRGYYSLQDASIRQDEHNRDYFSSFRPRSELQMTLSQSLGDYGSLYASGSQRDFWLREGTQRTWGLGYSTSVKGISLGINASRTLDTNTHRDDDRLSLNVSVPLSRWLPGNDALYSRNSMQFNYGMTTDSSHHTSQMAGLSGSLLDDGRLNYSLSTTQANQGQGNSTSLSTSYRGRAGEVTAGYSRTRSQTQVNAGLKGGVVVHPWGITLSQSLGETIALVRAPGASGLKVNNQTGVSTDWRGYTVVPYLSPYRRTELTLDPSGLDNEVAMNKTSTTVVPTRGAVVLADYPTQQGRQALMSLQRIDHTPVPFGAMVSQKGETQSEAAIVGDNGQVFLTGLPDEGTLDVQWGNAEDQHCQVSFRLPAGHSTDDGVPLQLSGQCLRAGA